MPKIHFKSVSSVAINPIDNVYRLHMLDGNGEYLMDVDFTKDQLDRLSAHIMSIYSEEYYQQHHKEIEYD